MKRFVSLALVLSTLLSILCSCQTTNPKIPSSAGDGAQETTLPVTDGAQANSLPLETPPPHNGAAVSMTGDVIKITEKMYVTYVNDIYLNKKGYIGKTIQLEGMYTNEVSEGNTYHFVYRKGPGCCGTDGNMCGFEFSFPGNEMPEKNDWIKVDGKLRSYEENGQEYLTIDAEKLEIMDTRGAEIVAQ